MKNIYEISEEIDFILDACEDNGGEISEDDFARLAAICQERDALVTNIAMCITNMNSRMAGLSAEIDRLKERYAAIENMVLKMREYINNSTPADYKLKNELFTIFKSSSTRVVIPENALPASYAWSPFVRTRYEWDKTAIKEHLKNVEDGKLEIANTKVTEEGVEPIDPVVLELVKTKHIVIK